MAALARQNSPKGLRPVCPGTGEQYVEPKASLEVARLEQSSRRSSVAEDD